MASWLQIIVQITVTPVATAAATWAVASAVVRRQEIAKQRIESRGQLREKIGETILPAEVYLSKHLIAGFGDPAEVFYNAYEDCAEILTLAEWLPWYQRKIIARYCIQAYGRPIIEVAKSFPSGPREVESVFDKIQFKMSDGVRELSTTYGKGQVLEMAFGRDLSPMVPHGNDVNVLQDKANRGYLNIFRLTSTDEARLWKNVDKIRRESAIIVMKSGKIVQRLNIWALVRATIGRFH